MRLILFILPILSWNAFGQRSYVPMVSLNYGQFLSGQLYAHEAQLGGGTQLNDYFAVQFALRGIIDRRGTAKNNPAYYNRTGILAFGIESSYRMLRSKIISPLLGI